MASGSEAITQVTAALAAATDEADQRARLHAAGRTRAEAALDLARWRPRAAARRRAFVGAFAAELGEPTC